MNKLLKSKKAIGIDDTLPILLTLGLFLLAITFFMIDNSVKENKIIDDTDILKQEIQATDYLLAYLQMSVDENTNIADLITSSYLKNNFQELERLTKEYFDAIDPSQEDLWTLKIVSEKEIEILSSKARILVAKTKIPINDNQELEIQLFKAK